MAEFLQIRNDRLILRISRRGGAIVDGHAADGRPFLRPYDGDGGAFDVRRSACFPMLPIGNRVEGNAFDLAGRRYRFRPNTLEPHYLHGDAWLGEWALTAASAGSVELLFEKLDTAHSPHRYRAEESFRLNGAKLDIGLAVENTGDEVMPFGPGLHPFFPRTPQTTLHAMASTWWAENPDHLPGSLEPLAESVDFSTPGKLPARRLNNCFEGWNGHARILWPENRLGVIIEADRHLGRYMLYAPEDDRSFFCFEPMSHTPNALAHLETDAMGLQLLAPKERLSVGCSLTVFEWSETDG